MTNSKRISIIILSLSTLRCVHDNEIQQQTPETLTEIEHADYDGGYGAINLPTIENPGEGFTLCQLDNGYGLSKAEQWIGERVILEVENNFVEENELPIDQGESFRNVTYHGTSAMSPSVSSIGIAPKAKFRPFRVKKKFVAYAGTRMGSAFMGTEKALSGALKRIASNKLCDVVSIAQGTLWAHKPTCSEVGNVLKKGTIIVAAGGQLDWSNKMLPIFPANYSAFGFPVTAVGGFGEGYIPWSHSFRGQGIYVSAPAVSVYALNQKSPEVVSPNDDNDNKGITFAQAFVSGAALLWLQKHGGIEGVMKKIYPNNSPDQNKSLLAAVPCAFRMAIAVSSYRSASKLKLNFREQGFGFGPLDIDELLKTKLPTSDLISSCMAKFESEHKKCTDTQNTEKLNPETYNIPIQEWDSKM